MSYVRHTEGMLAAHALLVDIALHPDPNSAERLGLVLRLVKDNMTVLAIMMAKVFDQTSVLPPITKDLEMISGIDAALDLGEALDGVMQMRRSQSLPPLPVRFVDEHGNPDNVIYIKDWLAKRRAAA